MRRVLIIGPTSAPWEDVADEVAADLGATGFSHLVELFTAIDGVRVVIDPLHAALECCLAVMDGRAGVVPVTSRRTA